MEVRTRFAPSPTGYMHIGNLRTAIFEYALARRYNGKFILRIEDTDQERKVDGAIEFIYKTLELCGFKIDEGPLNAGEYGPYIQSERKDLYKKYAEQLVSEGKAYYCFCTEVELSEMREIAAARKVPFQYNGKCSKLSKEEIKANLEAGKPYVIRQKMPKEGITVVEDVIYGKIKIDNSVLDDQILLKSDGFPTYNFANVIDDHLMEITHVIRGKEYLDQTAKYNLLYDAFGWKKPTYIHVAMVLGEDGNKLSKRNGDASFMDLYEEGYLPEAIVNYLCLLGWSPNSNQEVFTLKDLETIFDETRVSKSSSGYDPKKLQWFNQQYIKNMEEDKYLSWIKNYLELDVSSKSEEWVNKLLLTYRSHISYGKEINNVVKNFFTEEYNLDDECKEFLASDEIIPKVIDTFADEIEKITDWNTDNINAAIEYVKINVGVKGKLLYMPLRIKASGYMHGPELDACIYLLGKEKTLANLKKVIK